MEFPKCVKSLLSHAAYDTIASLANLDEAKIQKLEVFLNENKGYINELKCCQSDYYKQLKVFEFLPGHKSLLLELPKQIKELQNDEIKRKNTKLLEVVASDDETCDEMKKKVIKKMMKYLRKENTKEKQDFEFEEDIISEANIQDFRRIETENDVKWKCIFTCPFCPKTYSLLYKNYWMCSNATKHLKKHIQNNS